MEKSVRSFVGRILAIHLVLLALLLAVVSVAAWRVYESARIEAVEQARVRQTILAEQTARAIDGFYESILSDLNLLRPGDEETSDLPQLPQQTPTSPEVRPFGVQGIVRQALGQMLVRQLDGRARLILIDEQMRPRLLGSDERPPSRIGGGKLPRAALAPPPPTPQQPAEPFDQTIVTRFGPWLKTLREPAISNLQLIDDREIKLVSVPLISGARVVVNGKPQISQRRNGWLVAAVSAKPIETAYLVDLGLRGVTGAFLVDETSTIMAAARHDLVGAKLDASADPTLQKALADLSTDATSSTQLVQTPFLIGRQSFKPSIIGVCPVRIMGQRWFVLIIEPLQKVDEVVRVLARRALFWAVFVAVSMAAILVSTAAQLIFSRMKIERVRHQLLQNEMRQARQIQLAWLPQKTKTTLGQSRLEIATLNRPATHISGDFYNFFDLPDGRTAVLIGDVTGHGTAAAFLMATTQLLLRNTLPQLGDPGRSLEEVNRQLTLQVFNGQFVTMQVLVIDASTGQVEIATAGHPSPLLGESGEYSVIDLEPQLVAGVDPTAPYPTERFLLRPGNALLLYTDGVIETENRQGKRLRIDGLRAALSGATDHAETLLQKAVSAVNTFRQGEELRDDLTMVAIRFVSQAAEINPTPAHQSSPPKVSALAG